MFDMIRLNMKLNSKYIFSILALVNVILFGFFIYDHFFKDINFSGDFSEIEALKGSGMGFKELSIFFADLAEKEGGEYAYKSLARAAKMSYITPGIDLHLLGHVVGDVLYKQQGIEGIKVCTNDLRNACSHSIVVGAFLEKGRPVLKEVVEACKLAPGGRGAYTMCVHGLGHGILAFTEYDMAEAVKICEDIGKPVSGDRVYLECIGGIVMEMMAGINDREQWEKQKPKYFSEKDPLAPCNMDFMPDAARPMCYNFLTPHLFEFAGANLGRPLPENFKKAFTYCNKIPKNKVGERISCYGGFGKEFVVLVNDRNVQSIEDLSEEKLKRIYEWCDLADDPQGVIDCMKFSLQSLYWGGENDKKVAIAYCGLIPNEENSKICYDDLINSVGYYYNDANYHEAFCREVPESVRSTCNSRLLR
jgi:hypothetical protein